MYNRRNNEKLKIWYRKHYRKDQSKDLCPRCHKPNDRLPKSICSMCAEYQHNLYLKHKEHFCKLGQKRGKKYRDSLKAKVLQYYGNKCACCGESSHPFFLTIDHINNDGARQRKYNKKFKSSGIYRWLINHNFPEGFQLLCWNCNVAKHLNGGICPHLQPKEVMSYDAIA